MIKLKNAYKNGKSLQWSIANPEMVDGMVEHLEMMEENEKEQLLEMFFTDLSWLDYYNMSDYIKERIEVTPEPYMLDYLYNRGHWDEWVMYLCGEIEEETTEEPENDVYEFSGWEDTYLHLDHVSGYHLSYKVGDTIEPELLTGADNIDCDCKSMVFIGTVGNLSEELELQADNGGCAYHYIGPGYFEVWLDSRFFKA